MRTTIDLTDDRQEAATALGTRGKTETVNAALEEIVARRRREEAVDAFRRLPLDLDDDSVMEAAWA